MKAKKKLRRAVIAYYDHPAVYDLIISIILFVSIIYLANNYFSANLDEIGQQFFSAIAAISATLLGFLIAAVAILVSVLHGKDINIGLNRDAKDSLFSLAHISTFYLFITTIINIVGILILSNNLILFYASIYFMMISVISLNHVLTTLRWSICKVNGKDAWLFRD